jgi:hypothetical protein
MLLPHGGIEIDASFTPYAAACGKKGVERGFTSFLKPAVKTENTNWGHRGIIGQHKVSSSYTTKILRGF